MKKKLSVKALGKNIKGTTKKSPRKYTLNKNAKVAKTSKNTKSSVKFKDLAIGDNFRFTASIKGLSSNLRPECKKTAAKIFMLPSGQKMQLLDTAVIIRPIIRKNKPSGKPKKTNQDIPEGAVKIYDNVHAIEAKKGRDSLWPEQNFRHDFNEKKGDAAIYGLKDGSILIKGRKRLWNNFNY
jgi:hypothetical protein